MEVRKGYKRTELGELPKEWDIKTYGEVFDFLPTASYSRAETIEFGTINYVHYGDIHTKWHSFLDLKKHELPKIINEKVKDYPLLKDGDLIVADASEDYEGIGKSIEVLNIENKKAISGLHTYLLRDKGFLKDGYRGYLHSNKLIKKQFDKLATGLKVFGISKNNIKVVKIPLPPLAEQTAIANALSDADALISSLEKLIAKKQLIKQGAMQELLKPKKGWEVKKLGEIAEVRDGTHQTPKYVEHGVPFYSVESVTKNDFTNTKYISLEEHQFLTKSFKMEKGDILMTRIGSIGDCKLIDWDVDASFYVSLALLKIKIGYSAEFIYHYSKSSSFKKETELNSLQTAIPKKINLGPISNIKLEIPDFAEQNRIATILSDMDSEISALESKLEKFRQIKQGMMQNLLTGKIRLV
ncbi:MAG: restriction endonuclease subunit S [Cytophagaceae bacterium]|jgi:type I restriction enzyme S subunit|nr:restriction endonuclease subunit S [Cytophagaceae bacterium]